MKKYWLLFIALSVGLSIGVNAYTNVNSKAVLEGFLYRLAQPKIPVYKLTGEYDLADTSELKDYVTNGWYIAEENNAFDLYNVKGETMRVVITHYKEMAKYIEEGWYAYPVCCIYKEDGSILTIYEDELDYYLAIGWSDEPYTIVYRPDGNTKKVKLSELSNAIDSGWYSEPVCFVYKETDGAIVIPVSKKEEYFSNGWSETIYIYSTDGRVGTINVCELYAYEKLGWYKNKEEANNSEKETLGSGLTKPGVRIEMDVNIVIDQKVIEFDVNPIIINGSTMVPIRAIFEKLGASVEWNASTQTVVATRGNTNIFLPVNSEVMLVNMKEIILNEPALVVNGRTMVPVRAISESFGCQVGWDPVDSTVSIIENADKYVLLYSPNGRSRLFAKKEACKYVSVGWFWDNSLTNNTPHVTTVNDICFICGEKTIVTMYNTRGETIEVNILHVDDYKKIGWYETKDAVTQTVYSVIGPKVVYKSEVQSYLNKGWRESPYPMATTDACSFEVNSVDGVKLNWWATNTSGKTINYYHVMVYFINPVGDPAYDEITYKNSKRVNYVGPIEPNERLGIYSIVGYVSVCDQVLIGEVEIEYEDGTTETVWCGQVAKEGNVLTKWDGTMIYR